MIVDIEELEDSVEENIMFLEPRDLFDGAILGLAERAGGVCIVAYDRDACIHCLMKANSWNWDAAEDWFQCNVADAWHGEGTPVFIDRLDPMPNASGPH